MDKSTQSTTKKSKDKKLRLLLDNASRWYPMYATKKMQSLFCLGVSLQDEVKPDVLERAINDVINRFPAYKVTLKCGYGWHYLKEIDAPIKVFEYDGNVLVPIKPKNTNGYWFELYYTKHDVLLKMFHGLCDGFGAMGFFKCLLARYHEILGVEYDATNIINWREEPNEEEYEDGYERHYKPISLAKMDLKGMAGGEPHRFSGTRRDTLISTRQYASCKSMLQVAKSMGATFTTFIAGVLAYTIEQVCHNKKPSVIMVPVNLRAMFPSKTMRNFVTFVRVVIPPNQHNTLEEFVKEAQRQVKQKAVKDNLEGVISTTTKAQNNPVLKVIPAFLKSWFMRLGRVIMNSRQTMIISNIGQVNMPKEFGVKDFFFHMNSSKQNPINLGVLTQDDMVLLSFSRAIEESDFQDAFFENLQSLGIEISNKKPTCLTNKR